MKKLSNFLVFNYPAFAKGKRFVSVGIQEWVDYSTGVHLGTKVEAVIIEDNTDYQTKPGEQVSNLFEKLVFKIGKDIDIPLNVEIQAKGVSASVYGEYRNQLSLQAEDIVVVTK